MDEDFEDFHNEENGVGQELDPSIFFYPEPYCGIVNKMHTSCFETRYYLPIYLLTFILVVKSLLNNFCSILFVVCLSCLVITRMIFYKHYLQMI